MLQFPLFEPPSDWELPDLVDLSYSKYIGFDVETNDPNLKKRGPGAVRGDGHLAGISLAADDGYTCYLPIGHDLPPNMSKKRVLSYLREQLGREHQTKVGANVLYDLEWLAVNGVEVKGPLFDVQVAEPLIDENQMDYSLERLSQKYLNIGKQERELKEAVVTFCGEKADVKGNIWRVPAKFVAKYAEADANHPLNIMLKQLEEIEKQGLERVLKLEHRLIPLLLQMRLSGVRVDVDRAEKVSAELDQQQVEAQKALDRFIGAKDVNVWSAHHLQRAFDDCGYSYPYTEKGAPSFTQAWLEDQEHDLAKHIVAVRRLDRSRKTYIDEVILENEVNGRVYTQFLPLKRSDGGTVTGRLSSKSPNLQQVPARDPVLAPLVRSCFIPEEGCYWECDDFSQIEPRVAVHFAHKASVQGAQDALNAYLNDVSTDFHQLTADLTGLDRKPAKTINLALMYGMGLSKLANDLAVVMEEAKRIKVQYGQKMPFIEKHSSKVNSFAEAHGFIRTLAGRKRHFDLYVPKDFTQGKRPLPLEEAKRVYEPPLQRFKAHTAYNGLVQGSAADVMKTAMLLLYESGIYDEIPIMHLTVHDETDHSIPHDKKEISREIKYIMTERVQDELQLFVPLKVDQEIGPNWGEVKEQ